MILLRVFMILGLLVMVFVKSVVVPPAPPPLSRPTPTVSFKCAPYSSSDCLIPPRWRRRRALLLDRGRCDMQVGRCSLQPAEHGPS